MFKINWKILRNLNNFSQLHLTTMMNQCLKHYHDQLGQIILPINVEFYVAFNIVLSNIF